MSELQKVAKNRRSEKITTSMNSFGKEGIYNWKIFSRIFFMWKMLGFLFGRLVFDSAL